jgi:hypothetical protein
MKDKITRKIDKYLKKSIFIHPSEFGKICELCHKRKPSRMYYRPINGEYIKICQDCWKELEEKRRSKKYD